MYGIKKIKGAGFCSLKGEFHKTEVWVYVCTYLLNVVVGFVLVFIFIFRWNLNWMWICTMLLQPEVQNCFKKFLTLAKFMLIVRMRYVNRQMSTFLEKGDVFDDGDLDNFNIVRLLIEVRPLMELVRYFIFEGSIRMRVLLEWGL